MASGANLWNVRATVAKGAVARVEESLTRALGGRGGALEGPGDRILAVTANALGDDATIPLSGGSLNCYRLQTEHSTEI